MSSNDSESSSAVLVDPSSSTPTDTAEPSSSPRPDRPPPLSRTSTLGIKKCWICVGDSTEDDPDNPPIWRSPCKCTLTAHENCLLDWIADLENPKNRSSGQWSNKILCPQCKSEIKVARPRNYIVEAVRSADRAFGRMVLPGLATGLFGTVWAGFWVYGHTAVYVVFGRNDAMRVWQYARYHPSYDFAYGLIPLNLIFARTRYSDFVLPSGTLFLLATQLNDRFEIDWTVWPPLPSTVFACLPAVRSIYNFTYEKMFGELNRKWLAEVQPRREEGYDGQDQNIADILNQQEREQEENGEDANGVVFELELNLGNGPAVAEPAPIVNPEAADHDHQHAPDDNNNDNGAGAGAAEAARVHQLLGDNELLDGTSSIGQSLFGALAFPFAASLVGELLKHTVLPAAWTTTAANFSHGRPGLFRSRWGRSVVGGCAFVVLKDALLLYCRWRLARSHRMRRVMDFDKVKREWIVD